MRRRTTSTKARSSGQGGASHLTILNPTTPPPSPPFLPTDPLLQQKYRELIRKHFDKLLDKLFADFTGLHFHVSWAPPPPYEWEASRLPTGCSVCCRLSGSPLRPGCQTCGPRQLAHALNADGNGHRFTCHLGVRNYWLALRIRGKMVGLAYLQTLDGSHGKPTARKHFPPGRAKASSQLEFARAARLLRFVIQHVQAASLADLRKADLTSAGRAVLALEKEQTRLHQTLHRHLPHTSEVPRGAGSESHADQIVHRVLKDIEVDYGKPVTLQQYARELGMNAAYLSGLFSHALGVPFKTYLTEVRMTKAKQLLEDPAKTASDAAFAVGYASENRFRLAFKKATGLSPKLWRETMQLKLTPATARI
jgi:AraC-like DNA-binding protein